MEESLLTQFAEKKSKEKVQEFYEIALSILTSALEDLRKEQPNFLLDYERTRIFPIGDYTNDTFIDQTGELEIVIATSNPQISVLNNTYIKNLREAKTKKQKQLISSEGTLDDISVKFIKTLVNYFDQTTVILLVSEGIKVLCLQEYGFKILIKFATYDENDKDAVLNFWDPILKHSKKINLFLYNERIEEKDKNTNGNYKKVVRIFKNIRKNILMNKWAMSSDLNKYFVELIIYNIPDIIMLDKDIMLVFKKCINYLDNCNILNFISFDGNKIETFNLAKINYSKIKNFINYSVRICF